MARIEVHLPEALHRHVAAWLQSHDDKDLGHLIRRILERESHYACPTCAATDDWWMERYY